MELGYLMQSYSVQIFHAETWRPSLSNARCLKITEEESQWLHIPFCEDEVLNTINLCAIDKAPGPDGFTMGFFKECWDMLKEDLM